ncbi:hypothetical protein P8610_16895 [Fictibacillus sp. UD]|uniref:hypothetical protein n=1 Tax=Fictibacillus sp. UD TaxID=3038777 RepID=UPI003747557E
MKMVSILIAAIATSIIMGAFNFWNSFYPNGELLPTFLIYVAYQFVIFAFIGIVITSLLENISEKSRISPYWLGLIAYGGCSLVFPLFYIPDYSIGSFLILGMPFLLFFHLNILIKNQIKKTFS